MRTDQQIVDDTNELAHYLLRMKGYETPADAKFYDAIDPRRVDAWQHAVRIMEMITHTEVLDALNNVLPQVDPHPVDAMRKAESFISGFEGDELQEGIPELLAGLRLATDKVDSMWALLCNCFEAWEGEEDSVKEEHADLIAELSAFIDATALPLSALLSSPVAPHPAHRSSASAIMLAALKRIVAGREIKDPADGAAGSTIIVSLDPEEVEAICTEAIAKVEGK